MTLGGGDLLEISREEGEEVVRESRGDAEEVSQFRGGANPLRLFASGGARCTVGRLILTDRRLILLPYSEEGAAEIDVLQKSMGLALGEIGLKMPALDVELSDEPVVVRLQEIRAVDPHQTLFRIHPLLVVHALDGERSFRLSSPDAPAEWAGAIRQLSGCRVEEGEL